MSQEIKEKAVCYFCSFLLYSIMSFRLRSARLKAYYYSENFSNIICFSFSASLTLPRTQSLKKPSGGGSSSGDGTSGATLAAAAAGGAAISSASSTLDVKDDKVSGANSSTSVYDNVNNLASSKNRNSSVSTYATLRQTTGNSANDSPSAKEMSTSTAAQTGPSAKGPPSGDATTATGPSSASAAVESKSSETQTVTSQTTQTPMAVGPPAPTAASVTSVPSGAMMDAAALQSITHRTQQPLPNAPPQSVYSSYPSSTAGPFQPQPPQNVYGVGAGPGGGGGQNYYNQMQAAGAIPRTYPQQPALYHGMQAQQQQQQQQQQQPAVQTLNRSGYYGGGGSGTQLPGNYPNFGTLPPQMYSSNRSDSGSYHGMHPQPQHPQQHHPYYERAYSVQGDISNNAMMHDMMRRSIHSGQQHHPHHQQLSSGGHPHHHRRDLMSSKSVDYSVMDGPLVGGGGGGGGGSSNGFMDDQLMRGMRRHRSRSTENVVNEASMKSDLMMMAAAAAAGSGGLAGLDSDALKRMLQPVQNVASSSSMAAGLSPNGSPLTSPEMSRRGGGPSSHRTLISDGFQSEPEIGRYSTYRILLIYNE